MKSEQLNWTDKEWAVHLGCTVQHVPIARKFIVDNYFVGVGQITDTKRYACALYKWENAPSGWTRFFQVKRSDKEFETSAAATNYANEVFIPGLELLPNIAKIKNVPLRALQMLHVKEK